MHNYDAKNIISYTVYQDYGMFRSSSYHPQGGLRHTSV